MTNMKIALLSTVVAAGIALSGGSAFAADLAMPMHSEPAPVMAPNAPAGNYISVFGGYALSTNVHGHPTALTTFDISVPLSSGYVVGGAVGTHLMSNLRGELEVSYASHNASSSSFATPTSTTNTLTGKASTLYLLGNLWYDIDTGSSITPYLGGGVGAAVIMPNLTFSGGTTYTTTEYAFAAQLGAGVKVQVADNISLDLGYRAKEVFNAGISGSGTGTNLKNASYIDQTVQVGLTFGF
jgi:opacity protein-like surface antigen